MPSKAKTPIPCRLESALHSWAEWHSDIRVKPVVIGALTGGRTNTSWLLESGRRRWVARLNNPSARVLGIDRARECAIHRLVAHHNIAPEYPYLHLASDTSIFEYVEGECLSPRDLTNPQVLHCLHEIIERYQRLVLYAPRFDYGAYLLRYWQNVERVKPAFANQYRRDWLVFFDKLTDFCKQRWAPVITHHDLEPSNILTTDSGIKIIDWEYSGNGHPLFDRYFLQPSGAIYPSIFSEIITWLGRLWVALREDV